MMEKGAIGVKDTKPPKHDYAIAKQELLTLKETKSFTQKVFGGNLSLLASALTAQDITQQALDDMIAMLQKAQVKQEH